jgi:hypothetical protein
MIGLARKGEADLIWDGPPLPLGGEGRRREAAPGRGGVWSPRRCV